MFFDEVTFGTVRFVTDKGVFALYTDVHNKPQVVKLNATKFSELIPRNGMSGEWEHAKYVSLEIGSVVAFELYEPGVVYATHWTTAAQYAAAELESRSSRIRIMQGDTCVWAGKFAMEPDIVHCAEGTVPDVLSDDMDVERDEPDDIVDTAYDTSYLAPGGWFSIQDPPREEVWHRIKHAKVLTT